VVVLAHGLCMNDLQWLRDGHDHGAALHRDLGYTPVYLRYNSGQHISVNGRALAAGSCRAAGHLAGAGDSSWSCWATAWAGWWRAAPCTMRSKPA
jgi:hypothetical protein